MIRIIEHISVYKNWHCIFLICIMYLLSSCQRDLYTMKPVSATEKQIEKLSFPDSLVGKFKAGIEFYASGDQPQQWNISMDEEGLFSFASINNNLALNAVKPVATADKKIYSLNDRLGKMIITIFEESCSNKASKKTEVLVNGKLYTGCGNDLYDPNLDGSWQLSKLKNKSVSAGDFNNRLPVLIFDTEKKKLSGEDGCNSFEAGYEISGQNISVGNIENDKSKVCPGNELQRIFRQFIFNQTFTYSIIRENLYLYLPDDSIIEYRRK